MIIIEKHNRKQLLVAVSQEPWKLIYLLVHARKIATDLNSIKKINELSLATLCLPVVVSCSLLRSMSFKSGWNCQPCVVLRAF